MIEQRKQATGPQMERRFLSEPLELRAAPDGKSKIGGYAAVFNEETLIQSWFGDFREKIAPGAFARALKEQHDVRALFNHDPNLILGRTKANTLHLSEDSHGLGYEFMPPDTSLGRDLTESIRRGDVSQSSFAFIIRKQTWSEEDQKIPLRTIEDVDLFDVSPVTYPAYSGTEAQLRSMFPDGPPTGLPASLSAPKKERAAVRTRHLRQIEHQRPVVSAGQNR